MFKIREVERKIEKEKIIKTQKEEGYKKIKPETNITVEEVKSFWNDIFA